MNTKNKIAKKLDTFWADNIISAMETTGLPDLFFEGFAVGAKKAAGAEAICNLINQKP